VKVSEAVPHMTKAYLQRVIDSFTRDFPKLEEERARESILKNVDELTDADRVRSVLTFDGSFGDQILLTYILEALLNSPDNLASEADLIDGVTSLESGVLEAAKDPDALKYDDDRGVDILQAVLAVALDDEQITQQELRLVRRLQKKLGLSERSKRIILAHLDHFPRAGNRLHTSSDFRDALIDLQRRGVLFYCNRLEGGVYVIPEEIVGAVRNALGVELSHSAWSKLLSTLTVRHLATILEAKGLPQYGTKEDRASRVVMSGVKPSEALDLLSNQDLYDICSSLPGAKVSGSKQAKNDRIIDYFANLVVREVSDEAPPGERYYKYLIELAARDRENLLANHVIRKDRDMESAFEEGTRYLFRERLKLELVGMPGSDHPDGCIRFRGRTDLLMWDNKSKESVYTFPPSHLRQFKRYIRDSRDRVSCFLVVVPEVTEEAGRMAARLKVESGTDTDVALITAEDLVWLAEEWPSRAGDGDFDLEVLNMTGILSRQRLEERMKLFL